MRLPSRALRSLALAAGVILPAAAGAQNRALGRPAFSPDSYSDISTADRAVDGLKDGNYQSESTFHSGGTVDSWWYVDLGASYDVSSIVFWNRTDCCTARIVGATIGLFDAVPFQSGSPAAVESWEITSTGASQTFTSNSAATGRYVGVSRSGDYLQIAEVEVFGTPTSTVPEPATVALVAGGLGLLGLVGRRRRAGA